MGGRAEITRELFNKGLNCAQAVLGAFCEDYGIGMEGAFKIAGGFGSGVRSGEICGAVSGGVLVIGLKYGGSKEICNEKTEEFVKRFKEKNGDITCRDILGFDITTPDGKAKKANSPRTGTCMDMVTSAADILEELGY